MESGSSPTASRAAAAAGLEGLTLHEARHAFASFAIAAGANAKTLSVYMGHANISITLDRYGHPDARQREGVHQVVRTPTWRAPRSGRARASFPMRFRTSNGNRLLEPEGARTSACTTSEAGPVVESHRAGQADRSRSDRPAALSASARSV
jgi:hypothetical protein